MDLIQTRGSRHWRENFEELPSEIVLYDNGVANPDYFDTTQVSIAAIDVTGSAHPPTVTINTNTIDISNQSTSGQDLNYSVTIGNKLPFNLYKKIKISYDLSVVTSGARGGVGISVHRKADIGYYFKGGIYNYGHYELIDNNWWRTMIGDSASGTTHNINDSGSDERVINLSPLSYDKFILMLRVANNARFTLKIKKVSLLLQSYDAISISASNQLKNGDNSPSVIDGQMGTYDSASQSYHFTNICSWTYSNAKITKAQLQSAKCLLFEFEVKLTSNSSGDYTDQTIHIKYGTTGYRLMGVIAGNGILSQSTWDFFWANNGDSQINYSAPLDNNRGSFHKVAFAVKLDSGTVKEVKCMLDGAVYKQETVNVALQLNYNEYNIYCDALADSYVKSYKVSIV